MPRLQYFNSPNPERVSDENEPFIGSSSSEQLSSDEKTNAGYADNSCSSLRLCSTRRRRYLAAIASVILFIVLGTSYSNSHSGSQSVASSIASSGNKVFEAPLTTGYTLVDDSQEDKKPAHPEDEAATSSSTTSGQPLPSDGAEDSDEEYFVHHDDHPADPSASSLPSTTVTRPAAPDLVSRPPPEQERFLAYLPHSGYHNQRIALANAILLGNLLNRTVLMPHARLGKPVGWKEKSLLQRVLEKEQKTPDLIERCTGGLADQDAPPEGCEDYKAYSQFSWSSLIDLSKTGTKVPLIDRPDLSREWLYSQEGTGASEDSILAIPDNVSYDYKIYVSQEGLDKVDEPGREGIDNYEYPLPMRDLVTPEAENKRVIEFGSLYGSFRINTVGMESRFEELQKSVTKAMAFDIDFVEDISQEMEDLMGGRDNYVGLHLRVGDGPFKSTAPQHMHDTLQKVLRSVFRYKPGQADALIASLTSGFQKRPKRADLGPSTPNDPSKDLSWADEDDDLSIEEAEAIERLEGLLQPESTQSAQRSSRRRRQQQVTEQLGCSRPLYNNDYMAPLNAHVYIATDAKSPRTDETLAPFFAIFPCAHILADFEERLPSIRALHDVYSEEERIPIFKFVIPFLEGITTSRAVRVLGTSGSTFSRFLVTISHSKYWPRSEEQDQAAKALWDRLKSAVSRP